MKPDAKSANNKPANIAAGNAMKLKSMLVSRREDDAPASRVYGDIILSHPLRHVRLDVEVVLLFQKVLHLLRWLFAVT